MKYVAIVAVALAACSSAESAELVQQQSQSPSDSAAAEALLARADKARIQGNPAATVWVVEVSDFQCPYCKMFHDSTYAALKKEFIATGQVRMAYMNLPLEMHANARPASQAAMCAALQDKFWQVHDVLFDKQKEWEKLPDPYTKFEGYARTLGVKIPEWKACYSGPVIQRLIEGDRQRSLSAGVSSTPSFFIGNEVIRGAAPIQDFRAVIQKAKAAAAKK